MRTTLEIANYQKSIPISPAPTIRKIKRVLASLAIVQAKISIVFVTDRKIHSLNKQYLDHDYSTDVLAFDLSDKKRRGFIEGEIIISATTAKRNAKEYKTSPEREVLLYAIHGVLHLLGYDDHSVSGKNKMRKKEKELIAQVEG